MYESRCASPGGTPYVVATDNSNGTVRFSTRGRSITPKDMRHRCACSLVVLLFQVRDHTGCEEKCRANEHLHAEGKEERPRCVVSIQRGAGEAPSEICDEKEEAAVASMVVAMEDARIAQSRYLATIISIQNWKEYGQGALRTTAPVIIVVLSSASPTPMARLTWPACAKDRRPTIVRALGPVS